MNTQKYTEEWGPWNALTLFSIVYMYNTFEYIYVYEKKILA